MRRQEFEQAEFTLRKTGCALIAARVDGCDPAAGTQGQKPDEIANPKRLESLMIETALEQFIVRTHHGERLYVADAADDAGGRDWAPFIMQLKRVREFLGVADLEQVHVLRIAQIVNAHAAGGALHEIDNAADGVEPSLRIERAVVNGADRVRQRLRGDPLKT